MYKFKYDLFEEEFFLIIVYGVVWVIKVLDNFGLESIGIGVVKSNSGDRIVDYSIRFISFIIGVVLVWRFDFSYFDLVFFILNFSGGFEKEFLFYFWFKKI